MILKEKRGRIFHLAKRGVALAVTGFFAAALFCPSAGKVSAEPASFDPSAAYHASLGLQTASKLWIERFGYYAESPGGSYCPYGQENWSKLTRNYNDEVDAEETDDKVVVPGEFTDVELKGNGTYTVKLEHADFQKETCLSQLQVATDIPLNDQIKFSDVKVTINDRDVVTFDEGWMEDEENYLTGGMVLIAFNHWRDGLKNKLTELGVAENSPNGWELLTGEEEESISVTFTVSGFNYDNEEAVVQTEEPEDSSSQAASSDASSADAGQDAVSGNGIQMIVIPVILIIICIIAAIIVRNRRKMQ